MDGYFLSLIAIGKQTQSRARDLLDNIFPAHGISVPGVRPRNPRLRASAAIIYSVDEYYKYNGAEREREPRGII